MLILVVRCRLQKFKLMTANTVISSENASMETMGTEQVTWLLLWYTCASHRLGGMVTQKIFVNYSV
jgi:hypothetical protein